jgi:hypothetical protein
MKSSNFGALMLQLIANTEKKNFAQKKFRLLVIF